MPLVLDLLDPAACKTLLPQILELAGRLDIFHANAGLYVGGDLVDADVDAIDRMLNLNVNVVMKNVHDVLPHMIARGIGRHHRHQFAGGALPDAVGAGLRRRPSGRSTASCRRCGARSSSTASASVRSRPARSITALLADWPAEKLKEARESGSLIEASEVAEVVIFMLTRPRGMTIRDVVMLPTNFDL